MATSTRLDPKLESVRRRARRLRLRVEPHRRFDRVGFGVLAALLVDVLGAIVLVLAGDVPVLVLFLLGPLCLFPVAEVWIATAVVLIGAGCARRWRLMWGAFATQAGLGLIALVWPLLVSGGRWLPL